VLTDEEVNPYQFVKINPKKLAQLPNNNDIWASEGEINYADLAKEPIQQASARATIFKNLKQTSEWFQ
jgi:hypothetical protein